MISPKKSFQLRNTIKKYTSKNVYNKKYMKTSLFYVIIQVKMCKREAFAEIFTPYFNRRGDFRNEKHKATTVACKP